jgi:hypothetical protein
MTKNIELTDLIVKRLDLDYDLQCVIAAYDMVDINGQIWESGTAYFWVQIPAVPPGEPVPENWFQLPASYFPTLLLLRDDADSALTARFLV